MSEQPISITSINDFIFCPASIYFHMLDHDTDIMTFQSDYQLNGTAAHESIDAGKYSSKKEILMGIEVYSERYDLFGKIDLFNMANGKLVERKKRIKTIFDGYVFQLYAQYFGLIEAGYDVKTLELYSLDDNTSYKVKLPEEDIKMLAQFEQVLINMRSFIFDDFQQENPLKCSHCIYEPLCSFSVQGNSYDNGS